jgi:4-diphosphocytidyl-2-C-methyl-D-erythritol kinase
MLGIDYGALGGIVSGSGPTVAFLVSDEEHAMDLTVALSASGVVSSIARAIGPAMAHELLRAFKLSYL